MHCAFQMISDLALLTDFCVNNPELEELEAALSEFNIFEAAGLTSQEVKHSRFLSFLLDPKSPHGIGDLFVTRVLQASVHGRPPDEVGVTALDLELMDLSDLQVSCESHRIDILLYSPKNKFVVIIENKVHASEHSNQLDRYFKIVEDLHPDCRKLPVLLSPKGYDPSDDRYFPISYEEVVKILADISKQRQSTLSPSVTLALSHYENLLRRHVVSDSRINDLCDQIIVKHRKAIELLASKLGDPKSLIRQSAEQVFAEYGWVNFGGNFIPPSWDDWLAGPTNAMKPPILGFWIDAGLKEIALVLTIMPGPQEVRKKLFDAAVSSDHMKPASREMTGFYSRIARISTKVPSEPKEDLDEWVLAIKTALKHTIETKVPLMEADLRRALEEDLS